MERSLATHRLRQNGFCREMPSAPQRSIPQVALRSQGVFSASHFLGEMHIIPQGTGPEVVADFTSTVPVWLSFQLAEALLGSLVMING
jgi:hypothetical protein